MSMRFSIASRRGRLGRGLACALAALLGARGRTRRALWLLIAGTMIMALGDQPG